MQDIFRSYYRPTDVEFSYMWNEAIFSFDTNVLLDLYRYTPETRDRLLEIFRRFNNRIWIPYRVAFEYHERRLDVISDQVKIAETIEENLSNSLEQIEKDLRGYRNHPFANIDQLTEIIKDAVERAKTSLHEAKSKHPNFIRSDQLLETLTTLFNDKDKIGQPYSNADLIKLYQEFDERYEKKVPPGYEDAKRKKDERKYGDVIIWYQLIDFAKTMKKPIIFVTGERKEDWWLRHKGETIGPRRELIREIHSRADIPFYMYSTDQCMERAEAYLGLHDQKAAIEEVRDIIRQDEAKAEVSENIMSLLQNYNILKGWETILEKIEEIAVKLRSTKTIDSKLSINSVPELLCEKKLIGISIIRHVEYIRRIRNSIAREETRFNLLDDSSYQEIIIVIDRITDALKFTENELDLSDSIENI